MKYREEYYDVHGRLVRRDNYRNYGSGRWPKLRKPPKSGKLVLIIYPSKAGIKKIERKAFCTPEQEQEAILMRIDKYDYDESIDLKVPLKAIEKIERDVDSAIAKTINSFPSLASEDMITAALGTHIETKYSYSGWEVDISFQTYSSVKKEPKNGADLSIVFDIKDSRGRRIIKTIFIQSKMANDTSKQVSSFRDLEEQIEKMSKITPENYVMLYGVEEDSVKIFNSSQPNQRHQVSTVFSMIAKCKSGDRSKSTLASAQDSRHVIEYLLSETQD